MDGLLKRLGLISLVAYLLVVGVGSALLVVTHFPSTVMDNDGDPMVSFQPASSEEAVAGKDNKDPGKDNKARSKNNRGPVIFNLYLFDWQLKLSTDQALMLLALLAGIAGSFLHAAQSLASYVGNKRLKSSWTLWYVLRPWIGGILGLAVFVVFSAGLIGGVELVDPSAIVALGMLGGWFSKTTTDKLKEVFETLFKTDEDEKRKDKLAAAERPEITAIEPTTVYTSTERLKVIGQAFIEGATVQIDNDELAEEDVIFRSENELEIFLGRWPRPESETTVDLRVRNPAGGSRLSLPFSVHYLPDPPPGDGNA